MIIYAYSARIVDVEVSSNAVINQMFLFFSYFMDGFAFTGEALVGKYCGSGDVLMLRMSIAALLRWTAGITIVFILAYGAGLSLIVKLLSDSEAVWRSTMECRVWVMALPLAGGFAFIYDGFYIGLTRTRPMLISTVCGVALFALLLHVSIHSQWMLWMAFACYLALRSGLLICMFKVKDQRLES